MSPRGRRPQRPAAALGPGHARGAD
jgi:hypothetical protein